VFDYETAGGSPLLGVKGAVIITHGRARRRMVGFACAVAADTARTGVPQLIADWLREDATRVQAATAAPANRSEAAPEPVAAEPGATS
jgi:phosphate acyltransferase